MSAILDPVSPMAKVTAVSTVFPCTGLPQIPTQSKFGDNELKQTMLHTEYATLLAVFYLNLLFFPCGLPRWWAVFKVDTGQLSCYWALCPRCAGTAPEVLFPQLVEHRIRPFRFPVVCEDQIFPVIRVWGWYSGDGRYCPATCCNPPPPPPPSVRDVDALL